MDHQKIRLEDHVKELASLLTVKVDKKGLSALTSSELKRFCLLYRAAATQLARMRTFSHSVARKQYLNEVVARAHTHLYSRKQKHSIWPQLLLTPLVIPQVVRRTFRYHLAAFLLVLIGGFYGFHGTRADLEWGLHFVAPGDTRTGYAEYDTLYESLRQGRDQSGGEKSRFASFLWQHNTKVSMTAFFSGLLAGVPTVLIMLFNGTFLGVYSAHFHMHGLASEWWAWILPHGVTEFLGIIILGGGGLLIGKTILVGQPNVTRAEAFRRIRGSLAYLVLLAFPVFLCAALIESFLRQSQLGDTGRYIFAAASALIWFLYLGFGQVPEACRSYFERSTPAESVIRLPEDDDVFELLGIAPHAAAVTKAPAGGSRGMR